MKETHISSILEQSAESMADNAIIELYWERNERAIVETDKKYELIKEIIKYSSNDQGYRFSEYFKNDDDIANRYDRLLAALK